MRRSRGGAAFRIALVVALTVLSAVWAAAPGATCDSVLPPGLRESLENGSSEFLKRGLQDYRAVNETIATRLRLGPGGEWWVVEYERGDQPRRLRGVVEGGREILGSEEAVGRAGLLKEGLEDVLYCCGTSFGAPTVREDRWSYTVEYPQVLRGVPVEKAGLAFRMLREFDERLRETGQWNVEVLAETVVLPAGLDVRPVIGPGEARRLMAENGLDAGVSPTLVLRRGAPDDEQVRLCWRSSNGRYVHYVDATSGELLPAVAKRYLLR